METVENRKFQDETVNLDQTRFVRCSFEGCVLAFSGERCEWHETTFSNCEIALRGTASNVLQVLRAFGVTFVQEPRGVRVS